MTTGHHLMRGIFAGILGLAGVLSGCSEDSFVACDNDQQCPSGYSCDRDRKACRLPLDLSVYGDLAGVDFAGIDASGDGAIDMFISCASSGCPDGGTPVCDPGSLLCRACQVSGDGGLSNDCPGSASHCASNGECVQCLSKDDCASVNKTCVANVCGMCKVNEECTSGLCSAGACTSSTTLLYVKSTAPGCPANTGTGSFSDPFCKLQDGMDAAATQKKTLIVFGGPYSQTLLAKPLVSPQPGGNQSYTANVVGVGSPIVSASVAGPVLTLQGATDATHQVSVTLTGFVIQSATGAAGHGILCSGLAASNPFTSLTLRRTTIQGNEQIGVNASNCTVTMDADVIGPNNLQGGIQMQSTDFTLTNLLVHHNGTIGATGSTFGGISVPTIATTKSMFNVTVADNRCVDGNYAGMECGGTVNVTNAVVFGNTANSPPAAPAEIHTGGAHCAATYSSYTGATGATNLDVAACSSPMLFRLNNTSDYYPGGGNSPCTLIDKGTDVGAPDHDLVASPRPHPVGGAWDIGAFEAQ